MKLRRRDGGQEVELRPGLEIGRRADSGLVVEDGSVSRRHARVERRGDEWWLVDLGSSNGTRHNGRRRKEFPIRAGDLVTFGAVAFDVVGPAAAAAPAAAEAASRPAPAGASRPEEDIAGEVAAERARIHAELRGRRRARGLGDLNQLSFEAQVLVGLFGLIFLAAVVAGVLWLGGSL
ncbi:MAG: FHA domain-containing protein [Planctomycetota bacterium]|nr:MAG: FHA domain-containing protein [Planctomycetota bacterium]